MNLQRSFLCAIAWVVMLCLPVRAQVETAAAGEKAQPLEEIIVYGTKQGLNLQRTTDSVSVFSAARLEEEVVFELSEAVARAVNTSIRAKSLNTISIRGIPRNGTDNAGQGSAINIYIDGAPASGSALAGGGQSLWDVQQIEVLRGSQSTVQGRNSIAGAVVVRSNPPSFTWQGAARVLSAEYGTRQYAGVISGPAIRDALAFRLSADFQETDGFVDYAVDGKDADDRRDSSARGSLLYQPQLLPDLRAELLVHYIKHDRGESAGRVNGPVSADNPDFAEFDPFDLETFSRLIRTNDTDTTRVTSDISYQVSQAIELNFMGTYEDTDSKGKFDTRSFSSFGPVGTASNVDSATYTAELSAAFDFTYWTGLIGAYYFESSEDVVSGGSIIISERFPFPVSPIDSLAEVTAKSETKIDNMALFMQWRFEPDTHWSFDFGLRYDSEDYKTQRSQQTATVVPPECVITITDPTSCDVAAALFEQPAEPIQSDDYDVWLPRGALTYNVTDTVAMFASVRRGYRAGGTNLATNDFGEPVVSFYDPEFLIGYEAGWRSTWLEDRFVFNGNAFYSDYEDQQINVVNSSGAPITVNAGKTRLYGLELSSNYRLSDDWNFYGNVGLLKTHVDEFLYSALTDPPIDLEGNDLGLAPSASMTLGVSFGQSSGLFGNASLNYRDSSWSDVFNLGPKELGNGLTERVGSVYLVNASIGYRFNDLTATVFATNLLDEDEPESIDLASPGILNGTGGFRALPQYTMRQPQTFGVSLDYAF